VFRACRHGLSIPHGRVRVTTYRIPAKLKEELQKLADADKRRLSQYLRVVLEEHVEHAKKQTGNEAMSNDKKLPATVPSPSADQIAAIARAYVSAGDRPEDPSEMRIEFAPGQQGFDLAAAFAQWLANVTGKRIGVFPPEWER